MIYNATLTDRKTVIFTCAIEDYIGQTYKRITPEGLWWVSEGIDSTDEPCERPPEWVSRLFTFVLPRMEAMLRDGGPSEIARFVE